jgi:hypothetical protein
MFVESISKEARPMQSQVEGATGIRREMMNLLRQQVKILDSSRELSDIQLRECYDRQSRVQALREKLQAIAEEDSRVAAFLQDSPAKEFSVDRAA